MIPDLLSCHAPSCSPYLASRDRVVGRDLEPPHAGDGREGAALSDRGHPVIIMEGATTSMIRMLHGRLGMGRKGPPAGESPAAVLLHVRPMITGPGPPGASGSVASVFEDTRESVFTRHLANEILHYRVMNSFQLDI